jgi:hypothetical protein
MISMSIAVSIARYPKDIHTHIEGEVLSFEQFIHVYDSTTPTLLACRPSQSWWV